MNEVDDTSAPKLHEEAPQKRIRNRNVLAKKSKRRVVTTEEFRYPTQPVRPCGLNSVASGRFCLAPDFFKILRSERHNAKQINELLRATKTQKSVDQDTRSRVCQ